MVKNTNEYVREIIHTSFNFTAAQVVYTTVMIMYVVVQLSPQFKWMIFHIHMVISSFAFVTTHYENQNKLQYWSHLSFSPCQ